MQQATLISPISGRVATLGLAAGQSVTAGSAASDVVVQSPGAFEVTTTVPDTKVGSIKVGDTASVTPDGMMSPQTGRVVSIGMLPTSSTGSTGSSSSSSTSTVSYPVIIGFDAQPSGLFSGSGADVAIVLRTASDALTVPSSAVRTVGGIHLVTVLKNGKATPTAVTVGAVGPDTTQVLSGLTAGQQVVLANLRTALPSSTTTSTRGLGLGGGGTGGAGGTGGGGARTGGTGGRAG